jgi:hypothetical protein
LRKYSVDALCNAGAVKQSEENDAIVKHAVDLAGNVSACAVDCQATHAMCRRGESHLLKRDADPDDHVSCLQVFLQPRPHVLWRDKAGLLIVVQHDLEAQMALVARRAHFRATSLHVDEVSSLGLTHTLAVRAEEVARIAVQFDDLAIRIVILVPD